MLLYVMNEIFCYGMPWLYIYIYMYMCVCVCVCVRMSMCVILLYNISIHKKNVVNKHSMYTSCVHVYMYIQISDIKHSQKQWNNIPERRSKEDISEKII